jgi:DNA-binding SARP family transcriptional activator/tetratricopeptide (TPR) repeat protein
MTVRFGILGPLEASNEDGPVALGGAKQRAFLADLLLHAGRVVPRDRLIDDLWGEEAPATAVHSLEVYASSLRKAGRTAGGAPLLAARSNGYVLEVEPEDVDAARFDRLATEGRASLTGGDPAGGAARLREALALWRGDPLVDVAYEGFAQAEIARLEEARLAATEDLIDADLRLGRHAEVVAQLPALVAEHPLRERLVGQLMLALYRTGRQADALEAYRAARERLTDELGIDPSPELRALETAILRQDDVLVPPAMESPSEPNATAPEPTSPDEERSTPATEVRKAVTAVAIDIAVTTPDGRPVDPERRRPVLERAAAAIRDVTDRSGGSSEDTENPVVTFGMPRVHEDDAVRAALAALEIRDRIDSLAPSEADLDVALRIGVATGDVVADERGERLFSGDVIGDARRLAIEAGPRDILLAARTRAVLGERADVAPNDSRDATFILRGVARAPASTRDRPPIVDREDEMAFMLRVLDRTVATATWHVFTIVGSPGIGKSRLVDEFTSKAAGSNNVMVGRCLPFGDGITFWPIVEAVRAAAGIGDEDSVDQARAKLTALIAREPDAGVITERVARLIGLSAEPSGPGETAQGVRRLLEAISRERPLVLVVEDLHWAEPTLLDLIEGLIGRSGGAAVLIVATARPEFLDEHPRWGGGRTNAASVLLTPLSPPDSAELLRRIVGGSALPEDVVSGVLRAAEGNALFLEQILSMLIDDGVLIRDGDAWAVAGPVDPVPIPPTIQALLASRVDRLTLVERSTVRRAAVIGKEFGPDDVEHLAPTEERSSVPAALEALVDKEWIRPEATETGEPSYRFRHVLMQGAAYDSIPKSGRAELHARVADRIEATSGERVAEQEELIGHHLAEAVRYRTELGLDGDETAALAERAATRMRSAGDRAFLRGDMSAAVALLSSAAALFVADAPERIRLLPRLGTALVELGRFEDAGSTLDEAWDLARASGELATQADTLYYRAELRAWRGVLDADEAATDARTMLPGLERAGLEDSLARCWRVIAICAPDVEGYAAGSERAMEHARRAGDRLGQLEILQNLGDAAACLGITVDEGLARSEELLAIAGDDAVATNALRVIAVGQLLARAGRFDEARAEVQTALDAFEELGLSLWIADSGLLGAVEVELLADEFVAAEGLARRSLEALEAMGAVGSSWRPLSMLAKATYGQGKFDEAESFTRRVRARGIEGAAGIEALLLARRGKCDDAEAVVRRALDTADLRAAYHRLGMTLDLAEVLRICGRDEDAVATATGALTRARERGDVAIAARAQAWLASRGA